MMLHGWNRFLEPERRIRSGSAFYAAVAGLVLAIGMLAPAARAERDVVHFADTIDVAKGSTIHDAVCFFCNVNVHGAVNGDIVVFFGSVRVDGQANHDVVNFFGNVDVADGASVGHDLVKFFGGVRLGENASVGQDLVVMFGGLRAADSVTNGGERVVFPGWVFWTPILLFGSLIWLFVDFVRGCRMRRMMRGY